MSWIRRRARGAEPPEERLPDLGFLALVKASLEAYAPGVTRGAELKGNSLSSPHGWAIGVAPPFHGGGHHYDLAALPDTSVQPDVPCFVDCTVALSGDPRMAADAWVQTAGACMLELLDRRGRFADHAGPDHPSGVPGRHSVTSGAVGVGVDPAQSRHLQAALMDANVLHRIADTFTANLESPYFNGVKVFYGGRPGAMHAEIRVNGERHEAASAALAALDLPRPTVFTAVRYFALLLPVRAGTGKPRFPSTGLGLAADDEHGDDHDHDHGATCGCGRHLDPEHPGFELPLPQPIAELPEEERRKRVTADTGTMMAADGIGTFLKVRLPIPLDDGRTVVCLAWVQLRAPVIEEFAERARGGALSGHRFEGLLCNGIGPWGEDVLRAPVVLEGGRTDEDGSIRYCDVVESSHPLLSEVLNRRWPAAFVLGDRDPRSHAG